LARFSHLFDGAWDYGIFFRENFNYQLNFFALQISAKNGANSEDEEGRGRAAGTNQKIQRTEFRY
jgi:hypothetical protein